MDRLSGNRDRTQEHCADLMAHLQTCVASPDKAMKLQPALHGAQRLLEVDASKQRLKVANTHTHA